MRRLVVWFAGTAAALVLLFSYRTSLSGPLAGSSAQAAGQPGVVPGSGSGAGSGSGSGSTGDTVVNGTVAQTRWGPVQVQVRISQNKIVDVVLLQQPDGNRTDREINAYAVPQLRQ